MQLFKTKQISNLPNENLLSDLTQTQLDLNCAYENLGNVVEPELIDSYIYQIKALQMRHQFLRDRIKLNYDMK